MTFPFCPLVEPVEVALDGAICDPGFLSDEDVRAVLAATERLATRLRAWQASLVDEANRRQLDQQDGAASPASWLTTQIAISAGEAHRRQVEAAALTLAPPAAQAFQAGEISAEHLRTIAATAKEEPAIDIGELVEHARTLDAGRFARRAAQLRRAHQADGGLSEYEGQRRARCCSVRVREADGMVVLHAELDPLGGAKVRAALLSEADRLWRAEHAEAGDVAPHASTHPQRLADALCNVFGRPPTAGLAPETAEVLVTLRYDDLVGTGDGRAEVVGVGPIPSAAARRLACQAGILPAVLGGGSEVLDLGRSRRLASRAQRRALRYQYGSCAIAGCDVPFDWCQIHHLRPWSAGGRTDLQALVPLCTRHHHLAHEGGWHLHRQPDGSITFDPPEAPAGVPPPSVESRKAPPPGWPRRPTRQPGADREADMNPRQARSAGRERRAAEADEPGGAPAHPVDEGERRLLLR